MRRRALERTLQIVQSSNMKMDGIRNYVDRFKITLMVTLIGITTLNTMSVNAGDDPSRASDRLILFQGFILSAYYNDHYIEVKRLHPGHATFYGYGWYDDHRVFVAYQPEVTGEAVAEIEIIDLRLSKTTKLGSIGGVGESNFDVNPSTGEIVYSTDNGINLLRIDDKTNSLRVENVKKDVFCWGTFWIDNQTIGCKLIEKDKGTFIKYQVTPSRNWHTLF